jgi:hypothetical protein
LTNTNHGNENQKKKLSIPGKNPSRSRKFYRNEEKSSQGQEKGVMIKKTSSK